MFSSKGDFISQQMRVLALPIAILIASSFVSSIAAENTAKSNDGKRESIGDNVGNKLQYEGLYQSGPHESNGTVFYEYLRFYENGSVVGTSSIGTIDQVREWLNFKSDYVGIGSYKMSQGSIQSRVHLQPIGIFF